MIACRVVDFPAPFGPIRPTISLLPTRSVSSRTAVTLPYRMSTPSSSSAAASGIGVHRRLAQVGSGDVEVAADLVGGPRRQGSALAAPMAPAAAAHHAPHGAVDP